MKYFLFVISCILFIGGVVGQDSEKPGDVEYQFWLGIEITAEKDRVYTI